MSLGYWFKLSSLILACSATVLAIYWLKDGHLTQALNSLGFQGGQSLSWCSERVQYVTHVPSGSMVTEEDGKWKRQGASSEAQVLDYLSVEKWFAKYCQIPIEKLNFTDFDSPLNPLLKVEFINGEKLTFYDLGQDRIQAGREVFKSPTLRKAIKELLAFEPKLQ